LKDKNSIEGDFKPLNKILKKCYQNLLFKCKLCNTETKVLYFDLHYYSKGLGLVPCKDREKGKDKDRELYEIYKF
jgi:hypothetical protein